MSKATDELYRLIEASQDTPLTDDPEAREPILKGFVEAFRITAQEVLKEFKGLDLLRKEAEIALRDLASTAYFYATDRSLEETERDAGRAEVFLDRLKRLEPHLRHGVGCLVPANRLLSGNYRAADLDTWRPGDEKECNCGLADLTKRFLWKS